MYALLLPEWFNPWGWTILCAVIILALVILIVICLISSKRKAIKELEDTDEPDGGRAPLKEEDYSGQEEDEEEEVKSKTKEKKSASAETKQQKAKPASKKEEKPSTKTYHISQTKDGLQWQVKAAGGAKAIKLFKTQKEAIEYAKQLADNQSANIMIHKKDGTFRKLDY